MSRTFTFVINADGCNGARDSSYTRAPKSDVEGAKKGIGERAGGFR